VTVEGYLNLIRHGSILPPIEIQKSHYLVDGRHRLEAYKKEGFRNIRVRILDISVNDILIHSIKSNKIHGKRLSKEDREALVIRLRTEKKMMLTEIAKLIGLSYSRTQEIWEKCHYRSRYCKTTLTRYRLFTSKLSLDMTLGHKM